MHQRDGRWYGELFDETPDLPTPSLGWTTWHPIWWMRTLLTHVRDETVPEPGSVEWPGPESALASVRALWAEWSAFVASLSEDDLASSRLTSFPYHDERPFVYVVGWASMEMTKNIAEMCLLRRLIRELGGR